MASAMVIYTRSKFSNNRLIHCLLNVLVTQYTLQSPNDLVPYGAIHMHVRHTIFIRY